MASASTPSHNSSSLPSKSTTNTSSHNSHNHNHNHNHHHHRHRHNHSRNQYQRRNNNNNNNNKNNNRRSSNRNSSRPSLASEGTSAVGGPSTTSGTAPSAFSSSFLGAQKSWVAPDFSGRQTTRFEAKMHSGSPRIIPNRHPHSKAAEEALHWLLEADNNPAAIHNALISYEYELSGHDDYIYLLKEFGNTGHYLLACKCYKFAMPRQTERVNKGKLTSAMIGTLGRLGQIQHALELFETSRYEGHGNTVHTYSAMITAFGRNGRFPDALRLFQSMNSWGVEPNLVVYNAMIDAGAKGGVEFDTVVRFFDELVANGRVPDRVTYNSLLSACVPKGMWEMAQNLLGEMDLNGIDPDLYTYNTYLDVLCKGGQMDVARKVMDEMPGRNIWPTVVTYSTMMDGYAKANRLEDALGMCDDMRRQSIGFDRVSYNTLVGVYAKLGWFDDAITNCREMERSGIRNDVVTYNALLDGYGKHGKYDEVRRTFKEMKARNVYPNTLTYSTMIDGYTKGGMYREAMEVYREFRQKGLEVDVVFYSALIDALCKNGLVESSMMMLDAMTEKGIRPNVVTYNSMIDAFGQLPALECEVGTSLHANEYPTQHSSPTLIDGAFQGQEEDRILKMFEQLAADKPDRMKKGKRGRQDRFCILQLFRQMHQMQIKPNVVTFSAILNACSRCKSFQEASKILDELRLFDNHVYGVAHGLLMGYREQIWYRAVSLFAEMRRMDSSTASAFYNALTDMLWHFGQKRGAQLVVLEGRRRNVWKGDWSHSCLDLHLMSCGAASAMVHAWLLDIRTVVFEGCELPKIINILTGWGKHSKVVGDGTLRRAIEALLDRMGSPFRIAEYNLGRFISPGHLVSAWLKHPSTLNVLVLNDLINHFDPPGPARSL